MSTNLTITYMQSALVMSDVLCFLCEITKQGTNPGSELKSRSFLSFAVSPQETKLTTKQLKIGVYFICCEKQLANDRPWKILERSYLTPWCIHSKLTRSHWSSCTRSGHWNRRECDALFLALSEFLLTFLLLTFATDTKAKVKSVKSVKSYCVWLTLCENVSFCCSDSSLCDVHLFWVQSRLRQKSVLL